MFCSTTMCLIIHSICLAVGKHASCKSSSEINDLLQADNNLWNVENSIHFPIAPVNDDRWQDFAIIANTSYQRFENVSSVSLSIYCNSPMEIEIFANDEERLDYFTIQCSNHTWENFSVILLNNNIYYLQNLQLIRNIFELIPSQIVIRTTKMTDWKIQNYPLWWTRRDFTETTALKIPDLGKWLLKVYTFLCEGCNLNISYGGEIIETQQKRGLFWEQSWQTYTLDIIESAKIYFTKYVLNNSDTSTSKFWVIDIKLCKASPENRIGNKYMTKLTTSTPLPSSKCEKGLSNQELKIQIGAIATVIVVVICAGIISAKYYRRKNPPVTETPAPLLLS